MTGLGGGPVVVRYQLRSMSQPVPPGGPSESTEWLLPEVWAYEPEEKTRGLAILEEAALFANVCTWSSPLLSLPCEPPHPRYLAAILHQTNEIGYLIYSFLKPWNRCTKIELRSTMQKWQTLYTNWIFAIYKEAERRHSEWERLWGYWDLGVPLNNAGPGQPVDVLLRSRH